MDKLLQMVSGFMEGKVLLAGAELGVFDLLQGSGKSAPEVAQELGAQLRGTEILLDALVATGILAKRDGIYRNLPEYEPALLSGDPGCFLGMLRHRNHVFRNWALLEDRVMGRPMPPSATERTILNDPRMNENFIRAMYAHGAQNAPMVVDRVSLEGVRAMADLGGGPGHYLAEFARRSSALVPYLIDLPLTINVARRLLQGTDVAGRIQFVEWEFYHQAPPEGLPVFDLIFLSAVVHAESPEMNRALLGRIHPLLAAGGRVVVQENLVDPDRTSPPDAALFAVNMLAGTSGGRTYTREEIEEWGRGAGLRAEGFERLSPRSCLVTLRRP